MVQSSHNRLAYTLKGYAWLVGVPQLKQAVIAVDKDAGQGGMNFKRKKFLGIMTEITEGKVEKLLVAHKDRLARFGFKFFDHLASENGCEFVVVNQESLSPQQEMVEDLVSIIHTFSCRLYGLIKYKKKIQEAAEGVEDENVTNDKTDKG